MNLILTPWIFVCSAKYLVKMGVKNFIMKRIPFCKMKAKRKYRESLYGPVPFCPSLFFVAQCSLVG